MAAFKINAGKLREIKIQEASKKRLRIFAETVDKFGPLWWESLSEEKKQEWKTYRQALCDITAQDGYPFVIAWPIPPE
jgi:hypothetical protein